MGEVGLEVKVDDLGTLWNARVVDEVALGSCLMTAETAKGLRRTNAMIAVLVVTSVYAVDIG